MFLAGIYPLKRTLVLSLLLLLWPVSVQAQSFLSAHERYGNKGASLKALRDAHVNAGAPAEHGVIDAPLGYGSAVTIPATLDLHFRGAGQIDCGSASTLAVTIQSAIEAPDILIFKNCPAAALSFTGSPQKIFKTVWFDSPAIAAAVLPVDAVLDATVSTATARVTATILSDKTVDASVDLIPPTTLTQNVVGPPAADACLSDHQTIKDTTGHVAYFCDAAGQPPIDFAAQGDAVTEVDTDDSVAVHAVGDTAIGYGGADASISSEGDNTGKTVKLRSKVLSHATDCPNNVTGKANQLCVDLDDQKQWVCKPTSGDCDTAAEWFETGNARTASSLVGAQGQALSRSPCTEIVTVGSGLTSKATSTCVIPADATVLSVPVRVLVQPGGTTLMTVTATTQGTFFQKGTTMSTVAMTTNIGKKNTPANYDGVGAQTVTLNFYDATGVAVATTDALGQVRVDIFYETSTPATS